MVIRNNHFKGVANLHILLWQVLNQSASMSQVIGYRVWMEVTGEWYDELCVVRCDDLQMMRKRVFWGGVKNEQERTENRTLKALQVSEREERYNFIHDRAVAEILNPRGRTSNHSAILSHLVDISTMLITSLLSLVEYYGKYLFIIMTINILSYYR